jgi:fructoselysine 3-epimerase
MKYSLSSFLFYNYSLEDAICQTARAGFDGIDIWGGRPHAYRNDLSESDCRKIRRLLEQKGLELASLIPAQFRYPTSLCSPIAVIRDDSVRYIQTAVVAAAALGAPVVSVCPGHTLAGQGIENGWETLKTSLAEICAAAQKQHMRIALEPADLYETDLVNTIGDAARLIAEVGWENLGVLIDSGHVAVSSESMEDAFQAAGDRLYHVHIDDNFGMRDQHLIPGEGSLDLAGFYRLLQQSAYDQFLCAELGWDYTLDPEPAAGRTIEQLRRLAQETVT